jgi:hypothetical protein
MFEQTLKFNVSVFVRSGYRELMGFKGNRLNTNSWLNVLVHTWEGVVTIGSPDYLG